MVEAEFEPAASVEDDAKARLGLEVASNGRVIEAVISRFATLSTSKRKTTCAPLSDPLGCPTASSPRSRTARVGFPAPAWLEGSVEDLADMVRLVSVPQRTVDAATMAMEQGIDRVAAMPGRNG